MPDLTAKRTLVKSPPELWEELSEVERLAKHLGAFGEITITKLEPEHTVAWEGEHASGTVSIEPSGWGTKVTLRAELPEVEEPEPKEAEPAAEDPPAAAAPEPRTDPSTEAQHIGQPGDDQRVEPQAEPATTDPSTEGQHVAGPCVPFRAKPPADDAEGEREPEPLAEAPTEPDDDAEAEASEPAPRRGIFGWLFRRRTGPVTKAPKPVATEPKPVAVEPAPEPVAAEPVAEPEPEPLVAEPEPEPLVAEPEPEPLAAEPEPEPPAAEPEPQPPAPELAAAGADSHADADDGEADALDPERVRVILDEALDALGAAHHRPFSRG